MCGRYYIDDNSEYMMGLVRETAAGPDGHRLMDMKLGEIFPTNTVPVITGERPRLMQWGFARPLQRRRQGHQRPQRDGTGKAYVRQVHAGAALPAARFLVFRVAAGRKHEKTKARHILAGRRAPCYGGCVSGREGHPHPRVCYPHTGSCPWAQPHPRQNAGDPLPCCARGMGP